jgi:hypothetical protein
MLSRKDSQYAVSLRQWRLAELAELGFARTRHPILAGALARCYDGAPVVGDTGRARSTSDVEQNRPPVRLTRADLGWRTLLCAIPELTLPAVTGGDRSALLEAQGIAVFRRDDDVYVALDYGESGGGHGHPDRLNVILAHGTTRWLDDLGTGSYVDPSLHWYRSTLAHNAPLVNGRSQPLRDGRLVAHDERDGLGWAVAAFDLPEDGVHLERAVVVTPDYLIDELRCRATREARVELPWHLDLTAPELPFAPRDLDGGDGTEDGFSFAQGTRATTVAAGQQIELSAPNGFSATFAVDAPATLFAASGPGQPASERRPFYIMRCDMPPAGGTVTLRAVIAWHPGWRARVDNDGIVVERGGERHVHRRREQSWRVEFEVASARSSIELAGTRTDAPPATPAPPASPAPIVLKRTRHLSDWSDASTAPVFQLERDHYRRTDESWEAAGSPRATIAFAADATRLRVFARVRAGDARFASADATNPFDNEHPDTMAAGIQLYVRAPDGGGAWMIVPEADTDAARARAIGDWSGPGALETPRARWRSQADGYEVAIDLALPAAAGVNEYPVDVDVIVNETTHERVRRRGQLVLSGSRGEFAYIRGDRHDPARLIPLVLVT